MNQLNHNNQFNHLNRLNQLDEEQKRYILHYARNLLTTVAERTQTSPQAVGKVFWGKTRYSPAIQSALESEIKRVIRRIRRHQPEGAPLALTA